jgi:hypothetical protein
MKITKILGVVAVAAMALMAFASTASATTLEIGGVKQTGPVTIHATLEPGTTALLSATGGGLANTCTESTVHGETTSPFTGTTVKGPITDKVVEGTTVVNGLSFSKCTKETIVVDLGGELSIENIAGTTNGTVRSIGAKVTVPSFFGALTCVTAASPGTDIGTLTGKAKTTEHATMDINAVLNCGFFLPSAKWEGFYTVTTPTGLGVAS